MIKELQDRISQMENNIFNKEETEKEHQLLILNPKSCSIETEENFHLLNESLTETSRHLENEHSQIKQKLKISNKQQQKMSRVLKKFRY
jgi:hypothetical protein